MTGKSETLLLLESLAIRMASNEQLEKYLMREGKGHTGERQLLNELKKLNTEHMILSDLYFETHSGQKFQIDHLLVIGNVLFIYEVKNYEGEWNYGNELFTKGTNFSCPNPLIQLTRTKNCFKQFLQDLSLANCEVKAAVVFINSHFTLFNVPVGKPLLLPTQIHHHIQTMDQFPPITDSLRVVVQELLRNKAKAEPFRKNIPLYRFEELKKGIRCRACGDIVVPLNTKFYRCSNCSSTGNLTQAILDAAREFQLLFPNMKLTVSSLYEWCGKSCAKQRFSNVLTANFIAQGKYRGTYYL